MNDFENALGNMQGSTTNLIHSLHAWEDDLWLRSVGCSRTEVEQCEQWIARLSVVEDLGEDGELELEHLKAKYKLKYLSARREMEPKGL